MASLISRINNPIEDLFELSLLVSVVIVPLLYPEFQLGQANITITEIATFVIFLAFSIRVRKRGISLKPSAIDCVLAGLILWGAISLGKSVNLTHSIRDFLWLLESGLLFYMTSHSQLSEEQMLRVIRGACYGAVLIGLLSIMQYYVVGGRVGCTLRNANSLAGYLIFFLPILISFKYGKRVDQRVYWGILATIVSTALVVTFTRGGWYAAIISLVVMSLLKDKKLLIFILLYVMVYSLIFTPVLDRAFSVADEPDRQNGKTRIQLWLTAVQMFKDNPISGVGIGNYYTLHDEYIQRYPSLDRGGKAMEPHNSYLKFLAELGIIGFALFAAILYIVARRSFLLWRTTKNIYLNSLMIGFICGAGAVMIQSSTNSLFHDSRVVFGLWIVTGVAVQLVHSYGLAKEKVWADDAKTKEIFEPIIT